MTQLQLRVGGEWVSTYGMWGDLSYSTRWPNMGDFEVTWRMDPAYRRRFPDRALVEVMEANQSICSGELQEAPDGVDGEDGEYTARGYGAVAEDFLALNADGDAGTGVRGVVNEAISRGWNVIRADSVPVMNLSDTGLSTGLNKIDQILNAAGDELGEGWQVTPNRRLAYWPEPTTPNYYLRPGMVTLSPASEEFARTVGVRYIDSTAGGARATVLVGVGAPERAEDVTSLGPMTPTRATNIANRVLARVSRPGWTSSVEVSASDLTTVGGQPAPLHRVRARDMVRLWGLEDDAARLGGRSYLDVVLGETQYTAGADVITITPVNAAAGTFVELQEQALRSRNR